MKTSRHWKFEELQLSFGLKRLKKMPALEKWLSAKNIITTEEQHFIEFLQSKLLDNAETWNEDELKFFFIGPLITLVDYIGEHHRPFNQRPLSCTLKNTKGEDVLLKGRVEFIVALGQQDPRQPYFFLHEYKQEKKRENDPLGQLLAAMLCARQTNALKEPLYGCFVVGRSWFFVILDGSQYAVSLAYDATQKDLFDIFSVLREARKNIEAQVSKAIAAGL